LFYLVFALCIAFIFGVGLYCLIDLFRERKRDREVGDEEALIEELERPARVRSPSPPPPYTFSPPPVSHPVVDTSRNINRSPIELRQRSTLCHQGYLGSGQELRSGNGWFRLCMQVDGSLVLYSGQEPIWSSRTQLKGQPPYKLAVQMDNQLCIHDVNGEVTWASETCNEGAPRAWAKLSNNGNFILYDGDGKKNPLWCTGTDGGRKAHECCQGSGSKVASQEQERGRRDAQDLDALSHSSCSEVLRSSPQITDIVQGTEQNATSVLLNGQTLGKEQVLTSKNGMFKLCMQEDGDLALLRGREPIWSSRTQNRGQPPYALVMQQDNQLCIYDCAGFCTWSSKTRNEGMKGAWAKLQNSGSFVIYDGEGKKNPLWCTRTDEGEKAHEAHQGSGYKLV